MGLGKTGATIDALSRLFASFETGRVLVVAPKRVALRTWPAELANWAQGAGLSFAVLGEGLAVGKDIARKFEEDNSLVHIVSRDNVVALVNLARAAGHWPYDTVVLDEASSFKSSKAQRFRALKSVSGAIARMIHLTGTPAPNGYMDLWPQMRLLDGGERLGATITAYRDRWFTARAIPGAAHAMGYSLRTGARDEIDARLADVCLSMSSDDYLDLPPLIENTISVELSTADSKRYLDLEREFLLQLENDETVAAFGAAALSSKLRQFCNGALYLEDRTWRAVHSAKLDALESIAEEAGGPVLCGYQFRSDVARIAERFPFARTLDEPGVLDAWDRG